MRLRDKKWLRGAGLATATLLMPLAASAGVQSMTPVDFLNLPTIGGVSPSPDGASMAFTKRDSNWQKNKQIVDVWLRDEDGDLKNLTDDKYSEKNLAWSPKGNYISFLAEKKKEDYKNIHLISKRGGKSKNLTQGFSSDVESYRWSRNGKHIYFLAIEPQSAEQNEKIESRDDMQPFEQPSNARHVWRVDLRSLKVEKVTEGDFNVFSFTLSDNGKKIAYTRADHLTLDDVHAADIWLANIDGGDARRITDNDYAEKGLKFSPDNKHLLFIADVNERGEYYYDANLFVVSTDNKKIIPLALEQSFEVEDARWAANGRAIYIQANMGVRSELWEIDALYNKARQLTDGEHAVRNWHYDRRSDSHSYTLQSASTPGEIWSQPATGGEAQQLTHIYDELLSGFHIPEQKVVRWQAKDGTALEGLLTLPQGYKEGQRYPLVVHTHGGPKSSDQFGHFKWRTYIPVLSAMGYAYFTPNYRGGRGYGDDFLRDMVGGYFNNAHKDVMSGVDYLIEQGIADPDKMVKMGWSAGGHMTNKIITYTDRFKAASSGAGAVDWVSMYGETDMRHTRSYWFGGTPWQQDAPLEKYNQHSPLKDMWKVKTPTLIFVGEKDVRVPKTQSIMMYRALRDAGVASQLYIVPREKHAFKELRHRLFKINKELEWFERFARDREYQWQPVPVAD